MSERAGRGSFILTSNRSPKDWYELFPNPVVAEGVLDRLINASFHVHMEGKSCGGPHPLDRSAARCSLSRRFH